MKISSIARIGGALKIIGGSLERKFSSSEPGSIAAIIGSAVGMLRRTSAENDPLGAFAGWVYFALDRIGDATTRAEIRLYSLKNSKGDVELVDDHELLALLGRPNPKMTKSLFFYTLSVYMKMFGEAPVWKQRDSKKRIIALWPLRPDMLRKVSGSSSWQYTIGTTVLSYSDDDIGFPRKPDPKNFERGFGAVSACALEIDVDAAAALWNRYFMQNQGRPEVVLETDKVLGEDSYKRLVEAWHAKYAGPTNAGGTVVLEGGVKAHTFDNSPKEAGYQETRNFSRDVILRILGIPESMFAKDSTYANSETGRKEFSENTIDPILKILFDWINIDIVPSFGDNLWVTYDGIVREDSQRMLELAKAGCNTWMTVNEVRYMYNLPPIIGGDVIYFSIAVQPTLGEEKSTAAAHIKLSGLKTEQSPKMIEIKRNILSRSFHMRALKRSIVSSVSMKVASVSGMKVKSMKISSVEKVDENPKNLPDYIIAERKQYLVRTESREKVYAKALRRVFSDQDVAVRKKLAEVGIPKDIKANDDYIDQIVGAVDHESISKVVKSQAAIDMANGVAAIAAMLGQDSVDISGTSAVVSYLKKTAVSMAKDITDTTVSALREQIAEGVGAGETIEEISGRISDVFDEARDYRSDRIARTEVGRAENFARGEEMRSLGATKRMWVATFRNTRPEHSDADGQIVGVDEKFDIGGDQCMYPGDPSLSPDQSINCQCSISPVVD